MKYIITCVLTLFLMGNLVIAQSKFVVQNKRQTDKIKFEFINNVIVIPVEINGVTLSFLLDTGVSKPILFNFLNLSDSLKVAYTETIFLKGLGEGDSVEALKSTNNIFKIGDAIKLNQDLYAVYDTNLNFSPKLGVPVHGIIGYDVFKDLVVEINYAKKYLRLTNPEAYRSKVCSKCEVINLEFFKAKPYINAKIKINNAFVPVKLLIDSGGSDSLWLFENDSLGISCDTLYFRDFLGQGLNGSVYGKRSKINKLVLQGFDLNGVNVAYPDSSSVFLAKKNKNRNGSFAGNLLKRFNLVFNYSKAILILKKNAYFKEVFSYNKSGIELQHHGMRLVKEEKLASTTRSNTLNGIDDYTNNKVVLYAQYKLSLKPAYMIVELRKQSPAHRAGLKVGDVVLSINGKPAHHFSLQEITHKFYAKAGSRIKLKIDREGKVYNFDFKLENPFY